MVRRGLLLAAVAVVAAFSVQAASADPTNAKNSTIITLVCGSQQVQVVTTGNGEFTPGLTVDGTTVFVPTAFDITFSFTPTGGATETEIDTSAKHHQPANAITCTIPVALNTFTFPEGTFSVSGTVTGFATPATG